MHHLHTLPDPVRPLIPCLAILTYLILFLQFSTPRFSTLGPFTLSLGHVRGPLAPDSVFGDEDDLASLEDVGHNGLHAGVTGRRDRQRERVVRLQGKASSI